MKLFCSILGRFFLLLSVASFFWVLKNDFGHGFSYDTDHLRLGSLPFISIGVCFIFFQLSLGRPWGKRIKGILLGSAFALWGSEIFLPKSSWLTLLDNLVIAIFVVDLGLIVIENHGQKK